MTQQYNLKKIRTLLNDGFNDEELRQLIFDTPVFKPIYNQLAQNTGKTQIVQRLLEYADQKELIKTLLDQARDLNPAKFEKYQPYYDISAGPVLPKDSHGIIPSHTNVSSKTHEKLQRAIVPFSNFISTDLQDEIGVDLSSATVVEIIGHTNHSTVEKCVIKDKYYIVKRTVQNYCNPNAIRHLISKNIVGNEGQVSVQIATPLAVWETGGYVWELHPFYEGVTLRELILDNKHGHVIKGRILGQIFNALLVGVSRLHEQGVLHRDISPSNILINGKGNYLRLTVIDCSFCSFENQEQIPIEDPSYSAPEQILGQQVVRKSDLYSIAATIYFLGNGNPPDLNDEVSFREGLVNLDSGNYWLTGKFRVKNDTLFKLDFDVTPRSLRNSYSMGLVVESLLATNIDDRPSNLAEILLHAVSDVKHELPPLHTILKVGELGYLTIFYGGFEFLDREKTLERIKTLTIQDDELQRYVQSLLSGSNA